MTLALQNIEQEKTILLKFLFIRAIGQSMTTRLGQISEVQDLSNARMKVCTELGLRRILALGLRWFQETFSRKFSTVDW